ncbi:hypothetical protein OHR68_06435 [Spirillospora sp. NBC_00431]
MRNMTRNTPTHRVAVVSAAAILGCAGTLTAAPATAAEPPPPLPTEGFAFTAGSAEVFGGVSDRLHVTGTATCPDWVGKSFGPQALEVSASQGDAHGGETSAATIPCDGAEHEWATSFATYRLGPRWHPGESATIKFKMLWVESERAIVLTELGEQDE